MVEGDTVVDDDDNNATESVATQRKQSFFLPVINELIRFAGCVTRC